MDCRVNIYIGDGPVGCGEYEGVFQNHGQLLVVVIDEGNPDKISRDKIHAPLIGPARIRFTINQRLEIGERGHGDRKLGAPVVGSDLRGAGPRHRVPWHTHDIALLLVTR